MALTIFENSALSPSGVSQLHVEVGDRIGRGAAGLGPGTGSNHRSDGYRAGPTMRIALQGTETRQFSKELVFGAQLSGGPNTKLFKSICARRWRRDTKLSPDPTLLQCGPSAALWSVADKTRISHTKHLRTDG
ncbi:unnamed protein product [Ectocarpus fasciculatus]